MLVQHMRDNDRERAPRPEEPAVAPTQR
jgi:hypothetical protein